MTASGHIPAPLITVYIPTRNRAPFLERALASVWQQRRDDIEVIVVDDASTDGTPDLLRRLSAERRFSWIRNEEALGACAARNLAIAAARGRYLTGLDDDDEMLPGRITSLLEALGPSDAFVCASDWIVQPGRLPRLRVVPRHIDSAAILSRNVVGNQIFAERGKVLACGGFDESLPAAQDYDLWIRMILQHGPARGLYRPLQRVHSHASGGRITQSESRRTGYLAVFRKHRELMDSCNRRAHLYNLRRASGHSTKLPRDARFCAQGNRLRLAWHAVKDLIAPEG